MNAPTPPTVTTFELAAIEKVLDMGGGYVLNFSDRTFAMFFADLGIDIDAEFPDGSKAKRLRAFLRSAEPARVARALEALLAHRGARDGDEASGDLRKARDVVTRLQATHVAIASPSSAQPSAEAEERKLPRMEVRYGEKLGTGAFGSVWRATDVLLERDIAVKFLTSTDQAMDEDALIREARSLAKLSHANLVTVHAAAWLRHPETRLLAPALTMELLHGVTLDMWWSQARPRNEVLRVASGIVAGVLATHAAGLVHGDIHEGNIMVLSVDSTAKLIDWRYHDTFLQRSTSHRRDEMAAEQRRVLDRVDTLFAKQGLDPERAVIRGKGDLQGVATALEDFRAKPDTALDSASPPMPLSPGRQKLDAALGAARSSAVVITGGVVDLTSDRNDAVNGEIQIGAREDVAFQLRIPCGPGGIPILTVPYDLLRSAWVDAAGRMNVALEWPLAWNGRELVFERGRT